MCDRTRFTIRTSDEIINRIEALSSISGEPKNAVANVLLAMSLGGTVGAKPKKGKVGKDDKESEASTMVEHNSTNNSEKKSGAISKSKNKRVSSSPTPPTPSQKKKDILRISQKEKDSSQIGNGRKPRSFEECLEYFEYRRIPNAKPKAREFFDFYEANGWFQGKKPIKKWGCCLTIWISNNKDWEPTEKAETEGVVLEAVLDWMEKEHTEWYEKHKNVKNINDIDGYYIDEFRGA